MSRQYLVLSTCDEWKSWSSMRLKMVTVSVPKAIKLIKQLEKDKSIEVYDDEALFWLNGLTKKYVMSQLGLKEFASQIQYRFNYIYVQVVEDGEKL